MNQSNEIALQLVNNYTEDINIALFPNVNNSQFVQSQTEATVEGQSYNIGIVSQEMGGVVNITQKNKITNETIVLLIPYTGSPEGSLLFVPNDFILFCQNWFQQNNYGFIYNTTSPTLTIYSDLYEYEKLEFPDAP